MKRSDEERFLRVYREHVNTIYRYCLFRTNSHEDAEDIAAETFTRFLKHCQAISEERVLPWLFKVAGNLCINNGRRVDKLRPLGEHLEVPQEPAEQPWEEAEVWQALLGLSLIKQQVVYLRIIEDMSFKDIASLLGKKDSAVKMIFYRAMKTMNQMFKEEDVNVYSLANETDRELCDL